MKRFYRNLSYILKRAAGINLEPSYNGPNCGGTTFIPFCKNPGGNSVAICFNDCCSFLRTKRFTAERGGLLHDVWNLRTVDDMKYQGAVWLDNYLGDQNMPK